MAQKRIRTISKVLIVYKKSSYQAHALDQKDPNYIRLLEEGNIVIQKSKNTHQIHMESFKAIKNQLRQLKIPFDVRLRYHLAPIRSYDLVITIGGDGTFLETSHYLKGGILLGINSVPGDSVGYFCKATSENFLEKMYQYLEGSGRLQTLQRLETTVDGKRRGPLALNDVLFANRNPAGTTRYVLKLGHHEEEQKSSGVWISPAAGSTAASHSAGGSVLPLGSRRFQFVVREPYAPHGKKYRFLKQTLRTNQGLEIISTMDDASIFIDGPHRVYPIRRGSKIVVQNAGRPIQAIW